MIFGEQVGLGVRLVWENKAGWLQTRGRSLVVAKTPAPSFYRQDPGFRRRTEQGGCRDPRGRSSPG